VFSWVDLNTDLAKQVFLGNTRESLSIRRAISAIPLTRAQFIAFAVHVVPSTITFSSTGRSGLELEIEMTASYNVRFAALTIAVAMTALVHGTMLAGFDNVAQNGVVAQQSGTANMVALQRVTVTASKS
jgi:hypothetical protein